MKKLIFIMLLIADISFAQTTILKVGTNGYVTIDGQNYARGYFGSQYSISGSDTLVGINFMISTPMAFIFPKKKSLYLDGDNGNAPFTSTAALQFWLNENFEKYTSASSGGSAGGSDTLIARMTDAPSSFGVWKDLALKSVFKDSSNYSVFTNHGSGQSVFYDYINLESVFKDGNSSHFGVFTDRVNKQGVFHDQANGRSVFVDLLSARSVFVTGYGKSFFSRADSFESNGGLPVYVPASENAIGTVGGHTSIPAVTPTITASAYSAGYVMGGVQTLTAAMRITNGTGSWVSLLANDKGNQKAAMTVFLYSQNPSNGTYTDRAAFTPNATDQGYLIGKIVIAAADWTTEGSQATVRENVYASPVKATNNGTALYAIIITDGTPTPASTSDLKFLFGFYTD